MGKVVNKIPVISQVKSAIQAISGDTEGARKTQEEFLKETPVVSQVTSAVQAIAGDTEGARKTQEQFYKNTVLTTPVVSQTVSAVYAMTGDTEEAKRIQKQFVDQNVRGMQELLSGSWRQQFGRISTSGSLSSRANWMATHHNKRLYDMLIPGTHDSATHKFVDAALVTNWARAQQFSIYDQLVGGIRYLDIRVNNDLKDGKVYCSHTFLTFPFAEVVNDVNSFIRANPSEVIFFAVQGDGGNDQLASAKKSAESTLNGMFTDSISGNETIGELATTGKNVVYIESHNCGSLNIVNSWNETQDSNPVKAVRKCIAFGIKNNRSSGKLILQALECTQFSGGAPGVIESILGEISSLGQGLEELATYSNYATLHYFLTNRRAVEGSNVVNIDFANNEIIGKVISMN